MKKLKRRAPRRAPKRTVYVIDPALRGELMCLHHGLLDAMAGIAQHLAKVVEISRRLGIAIDAMAQHQEQR